MADVVVRATVARWVDDEFPGWIEVSVVDADGNEHRIIDKVPVLTTAELSPSTPLPYELWIGANAGDPHGGRVRIEFTAAVETTSGLTGVDASVNEVIWL